LQGVSGATRPQIICPPLHCAGIHLLIQWRVTELYGRNGVGGSKDAAKIVYSVYCDGFLTEWKCTDAGICCQPGASGAPRPQPECPQYHRAINHRLIQWRVTELYGAQWRRRRPRCREDWSSWVSSIWLSAVQIS
jgi:hypothetical protein